MRLFGSRASPPLLPVPEGEGLPAEEAGGKAGQAIKTVAPTAHHRPAGWVLQEFNMFLILSISQRALIRSLVDALLLAITVVSFKLTCSRTVLYRRHLLLWVQQRLTFPQGNSSLFPHVLVGILLLHFLGFVLQYVILGCPLRMCSGRGGRFTQGAEEPVVWVSEEVGVGMQSTPLPGSEVDVSAISTRGLASRRRKAPLGWRPRQTVEATHPGQLLKSSHSFICK